MYKIVYLPVDDILTMLNNFFNSNLESNSSIKYTPLRESYSKSYYSSDEECICFTERGTNKYYEVYFQSNPVRLDILSVKEFFNTFKVKVYQYKN